MEKDTTVDLIKDRLIKAWEQIGRALTEQKAIEESNSDEAVQCLQLASEITRLAAEAGLDSRGISLRSPEWAIVSSAAEAGLGRLLSSAAKRTKLTAAAIFEADGTGKYRFINNRVTAAHPKLGKSDFLAATVLAIRSLLTELGIESEWSAEIPEGPSIFSPSVVLDAGPDKNRVFRGLQIQFYKRDASGTLTKYQPEDWQLELKTSGS